MVSAGCGVVRCFRSDRPRRRKPCCMAFERTRARRNRTNPTRVKAYDQPLTNEPTLPRRVRTNPKRAEMLTLPACAASRESGAGEIAPGGWLVLS
jgi:hypothetical protein